MSALDEREYFILAPSMNNDKIGSLNRGIGKKYDEQFFRPIYQFTTNIDCLVSCHSVIYIDSLVFERKKNKTVYSKFIFGAYTPMVAYLSRAECLGRRIIFVSEHNSMTGNDLREFIYFNLKGNDKRDYRQISHPSIWLDYQNWDELTSKEIENPEQIEKLSSFIKRTLNSFDKQQIPISTSTYSKLNELKAISIIYNPNRNYSNIDISYRLNQLYEHINNQPLQFEQNQKFSLIDYLKGTENGIAKIIESIIFFIPKLKEMKIQRLKMSKEVELLSQQIREKEIENEFKDKEKTIELIKNLFECIDMADNETKIHLANKLLIEKKLGHKLISIDEIFPAGEHED